MSLLRIVNFLAAAAVCAGIYIATEECPPNEEYLLCGTACPVNCSAPVDPVTCTDDCVEGCFCKAGFLRNETGVCINADECIGDPGCGANEEFLTCGPTCPLTCAQPEPDCGFGCSAGCFCKSGFVRDTKTNQCVTLDNCPFEPCFNENEVYDICNASCEPSCADPLPICSKACTGGCVCAAGYVRDDAGGCVQPPQCPVNATRGILPAYLDAVNKILHLSVGK